MDDVRTAQVRLDKWLWAARFFKTRSLAAEAIVGGHVHLNGQRVKPSRIIKVGDTLRISKGELEWTIAVRGISVRRGPASQAAELYIESAKSRELRERAARERAERRPMDAVTLRSGGRPSKRDRRRMERVRRPHDRFD